MRMASSPPAEKFPRGRHVVIALILTYALLGVMVFGPLAYLRRISGGLAPFDWRPFGYSVDEARAFLAALSEIGRTYYADVQLALDTAFPTMFMLAHGLALIWLTAPGRTSDRPLPARWRMGLLLLPIAAASFDYLENAGIAAMLAAGPQVAAEVVEQASRWTQAKTLFGLLTEAACATLGIIALKRWRHRREHGRTA
jgi:hypothetical protein